MRDRGLLVRLSRVLGCAAWLAAGVPRAGADDGPTRIELPLSPGGDLDAAALVATLAERTGIAVPRPASSLKLPMRGVAGALSRRMLADGLGPGAAFDVSGNTLVVTLASADRDEAWRGRLAGLSETIRRAADAGRRAYGVHALASYRPNDPARPSVLLVHGMNSDSGCFLHLAPALERAGFGVVVFDYPDNQDLDRSVPDFTRALADFRAAHDDRAPWAIIAHSMGGLVARAHVEGHGYRGDVSTLILIGTPNTGSALARAQGVVRLIEGLQVSGGAGAGGLAELSEGLGDAAVDLLPGSTFLRDLNARPRRAGVAYHLLAGDRGWLTIAQRREIEARLDTTTRAAGMLGRLARLAATDLPAQLDELSEGTGDGAVSVASTRLDGAPEPVVIPANHVELIRAPLLYPDPGPIACLPRVLAWLRETPGPAAP